jgi:hypothetical protein
MKLSQSILISGNRELYDAPNKVERFGNHYELVIGIGKDHVAFFTLDEEALVALNAGEKVTV